MFQLSKNLKMIRELFGSPPLKVVSLGTEVDGSTISKLERGIIRYPTVYTVARLANFYGVRTDFLLCMYKNKKEMKAALGEIGITP